MVSLFGDCQLASDGTCFMTSRVTSDVDYAVAVDIVCGAVGAEGPK